MGVVVGHRIALSPVAGRESNRAELIIEWPPALRPQVDARAVLRRRFNRLPIAHDLPFWPSGRDAGPAAPTLR